MADLMDQPGRTQRGAPAVGLDIDAEPHAGRPAGDGADSPRSSPGVREQKAGHPQWSWDGFRPLLLRLHFYVGIVVGPFVLIVALTGLLYTTTPQLERLVHGRELNVAVGTAAVPLADQVDTARAAVPNGTLVEVRPTKHP